MYRNKDHEILVIQALASSTKSRLKINHILEFVNGMVEDGAEDDNFELLSEDEVWNATLCLIDCGFVAKASNTAEYYRITAQGYTAYGDNI